MRRLLRFGLRLGLLGGIALAIAKVMQSRRISHTGVPWVNGVSSRPDLPSPAPSMPTSAAAAATDALSATTSRATPTAADTIWVEADGTVCPTTHPVKAKLASRLYHLPGMSAYARTKPDRCYPDEESAQADGLTKARR